MRQPSEDISAALERERRFQKLGEVLATLRVFLMLSVQFYLLLGFALLFVRPPSAAFYIAIMVLLLNTLFCAGCVLRFFKIRREMIRLSCPVESARFGP